MVPTVLPVPRWVRRWVGLTVRPSQALSLQGVQLEVHKENGCHGVMAEVREE